MTTIDMSHTVITMAKAGSSLRDIGMATGLMDNEVRRILDEDRNASAGRLPSGAVRPTVRHAPAAPAFRPPANPPPVGRLAAPGGSFVTVLRAGDMFADPTYQREVDDRRVQKMVAEYDVALVGIIEVSARPDGRYAIIDGQHRWAMLTELDTRSADTPVCCRVHQGLTVEQEAKLFHAIDKGRRALSGWDRWKARRAAGDPAVLAIEQTVARAGLRLVHPASSGKTTSAVCSTIACEELVHVGGQGLLHETLIACTTAWGERETFDRDILTGVGNVLHVYSRDELTFDHLIDGLTAALPRQLKARARARREVQKGTVPRLVAAVIVDLVNDNRAGRKAVEPFLARVPSGSKSHRTVTGAGG